MVNALCNEIAAQKDYLQGAKLQTIYFGGGTPSLLNAGELDLIFNTIRSYHSIANDAEITLEANPEDLTPTYCEMIASKGINRLSIGIQSFQEKNLVLMNRNHQTSDSIQAIQNAQKAGITNISIDLIYGIPGNSEADLAEDLEKATSLGVQHISAYSLTVEPKTVFGHQKKQGTFREVSETHMATCFEHTHALLEKHGFEAYETSNFAKEGHYSVHNTSYWQQEPYLGVGPSAHSFNGHSRQWNVANNALYLKAIHQNQLPSEKEILSTADRYNEYIMTGLRTIWGVSLDRIETEFGPKYLEYLNQQSAKYIEDHLLFVDDNILRTTKSGKFLGDGIASDLFLLNLE